ncbi:hypothetical protein DZF84_01840 [Vibrio parahaemolyticus]|nr:hypothetical protein [Vibrio parahaemolyticus]
MEENVLIDSSAISLFEVRADELILSNDHEELTGFIKTIDQEFFVFDDDFTKARYFYTLANCYSVVHRYHSCQWYSEDLSRAVINYRKALYTIKSIEFQNANHVDLRSRIETNLANWLSSQGRAFCCIPHWSTAIELDTNPVAIINKAENELFIAAHLYDPSHAHYHYYQAYLLIKLGQENIDLLHSEQKIAYAENGKFLDFKAWFEDNYKESDFDYFQTFKEKVDSKKQLNYLKWCGDNRLFLNDLNDVCANEIVYQDIFTLPSFVQEINSSLAIHEDYVYHGNFDEIKNDYCYARYLIFSAHNIPNEQEHFFNKTYPHVDDMSHTLTNLKSSHYKSAFRTLYSIFDKIAYFLNSFFDLNDVDSKVYFHNIFGQLKNDKLKPHKKLINSNNYFLHALFYILKDIRDSNQKGVIQENASHWLDPDAKDFSVIRNAMEHRSLKIVDEFGHSLTKHDIAYHRGKVEQIKEESDQLQSKLNELYSEIRKVKKANDDDLKEELEQQKIQLEEEFSRLLGKVHEKHKRSSHSLLITDTEFESRLFTLMTLVRNSIMYLSLAIHLEQLQKPDNCALKMPMDVPLKQ